MKKITLSMLLFLICFSYLKSQITNFSDFLHHSEMSLENFVDSVEEDDWKILPSSENTDGIRISKKYQYALVKDGVTQVFGKIITLNKNTGNKVESTFLLFNEPSLLSMFKNGLNENGYSLEYSDDSVLLYNKNKTVVKLQIKSLKDNPLPKDVHEISIIIIKD